MTTPPLIDISPEQWEIVSSILQKHVPQYEVWAFGSRAKWNAKEFSDLDLAVITNKPLVIAVSASLNDDFSESDLPWKVDLVDWATTGEAFRGIIERDKVLVHESKRARNTMRLGAACLKIGSGATPRGGKEVYKGGATALIRSQNIYNEGFSRDGLVYINDVQSSALRNVEIKANDVLLNITGDSVARCCQVTADVLPARVNQHVAIIRTDPKLLDARFLRYVLVSGEQQAKLLAFASAGATRPALTKLMIEEFEIPNPPLPEQKAIAAILGSLDDKIELNRRMNVTLEAMARALFQSWFVDFDPVRAKMDGRVPDGMDAETAALFPDCFEDSALGKIPKGWRNAKVADVCAINDWTIGKKDDFEYLEYVEISEVSQGTIANIAVFKRGEEPSRARRRLRHGDSVLSTVRPDRGAYFLALKPPENRVASTGFAVFTPTVVPWSFLFAVLTQVEVSGELGRLADGGAYPAISPDVIGNLQVAMSNELRLLEAFHTVCAPFFEKAELNRSESRGLAKLRDVLLPKLLSGKLMSTNFEGVISEAETWDA